MGGIYKLGPVDLLLPPSLTAHWWFGGRRQRYDQSPTIVFPR